MPRNIIRLHVICALLTDYHQPQRFNELCRFNATRTAFHAGKARKAFVNATPNSAAVRCLRFPPYKQTDADDIPSRHMTDMLPSICRSACTCSGFTPLIRSICSFSRKVLLFCISYSLVDSAAAVLHCRAAVCAPFLMPNASAMSSVK